MEVVGLPDAEERYDGDEEYTKDSSHVRRK
jgi:hypothetical protein